MLLTVAGNARVLFVGGKGGVGKTSTSSALALTLADAGERVLLVSTDPAHNLGHLWDTRLGDTPTRLDTGGSTATADGHIDAVEIDPQRTIDAHLASVQATMELLLPERMHRHARQHLSLAREAPGSHEAAVLERIADLVHLSLSSYDRVIFDTAPTGHTLRLLQLPAQLTGWTETLLMNRDRSERFSSALRGLASGRDEAPERSAEARLRSTLLQRKERFARLREVLADPAIAAFVIVLTPERIPVAETLELAASLTETNMTVNALVVNRRSPRGTGGLLEHRHHAETEHLKNLRAQLPHTPIVEVPLLAEEPVGVAGLRLLTAAAERRDAPAVASARTEE